MYIGCIIIDQSNWSDPLSLVVMMPDLESRDLPELLTFSLPVYISYHSTTNFGDVVKFRKNMAVYIMSLQSDG